MSQLGTVGFLREGNCLSAVVEPGEYTITFDPVPGAFTLISEERSPPQHVQIRAEAGQNIFVKVVIHSG